MYLAFQYFARNAISQKHELCTTLCVAQDPRQNISNVYTFCQNFSLLWFVMPLKFHHHFLRANTYLMLLNNIKLYVEASLCIHELYDEHTYSIFPFVNVSNHNKTQAANLLNENSSVKEKQHLLKICSMLRMLENCVHIVLINFWIVLWSCFLLDVAGVLWGSCAIGLLWKHFWKLIIKSWFNFCYDMKNANRYLRKKTS